MELDAKQITCCVLCLYGYTYVIAIDNTGHTVSLLSVVTYRLFKRRFQQYDVVDFLPVLSVVLMPSWKIPKYAALYKIDG